MRPNNLFLPSLFVVLALSLSFSSTVHADELPCGNIIVPAGFWDEDSEEDITPIENCADPFGRTHTLTDFSIQGTEVTDGGVYEVAEGEGVDEYGFEDEGYYQGENSAEYYRHVGQDYVLFDARFFEPTEADITAAIRDFFNGNESQVVRYSEILFSDDAFSYFFDEDFNPIWDDAAHDFVEDVFREVLAYTEEYTVSDRPPLLPGTYTVVVINSDEGPVLSHEPSIFERVFASLIPIAYAYVEVHTVTFTIVEESEETIDPLLLEYLPILRMHEDEDYFPMNVEAFVAGSALWDDAGIFPDELVRAYDAEDPITIDDLTLYDDSDDLYLAFSDPENAKSIDVAAGLAKYNELIDDDIAQTTVYARKMEDSYEDSFGEEYEFIVLQYWYFYAMNDWEEKGGLNNHEGDWESVFVFLDADTEEPKYVAFSAHHNDGDPGWNLLQYDSVRREWNDDDIERDDTSVMSYVALGSHANYPKAGDYVISFPARDDEIDEAPGSGESSSQWSLHIKNLADAEGLLYEGRWGADLMDLLEGNSGPQGPYFIDVSGHLRYHNPLEWAGIDKIEEMVTEEPATLFSFPGTGIELNFGALVPAGTFFSTSPYFESPKGTAPSGTQLLSPFWDIESDLENETFNTEVRLPIDPESLLEAGGSATLHAYWFNPDTEGWEKQESTVDETGNFVVFNTNHFSRYAIGVEEPPETPVIEEKETETETTSSKSTGTRVGNRDPLPQVKGAQTSAQGAVISDSELATYETLITLLQHVIVMYKTQGYLTPSKIQEIMEELQQLSSGLEAVHTY